MEQIGVTQVHQRRGLGAKPPAARRFFEKLAILMPLDYNSHVFRAL